MRKTVWVGNMSWHIKKIGERNAVRSEIEQDALPSEGKHESYLPTNVRKLILATLHQRLPGHSLHLNGVIVEGYGHHNEDDDSSVGCIGKLEITPIKIIC